MNHREPRICWLRHGVSHVSSIEADLAVSPDALRSAALSKTPSSSLHDFLLEIKQRYRKTKSSAASQRHPLLIRWEERLLLADAIHWLIHIVIVDADKKPSDILLRHLGLLLHYLRQRSRLFAQQHVNCSRLLILDLALCLHYLGMDPSLIVHDMFGEHMGTDQYHTDDCSICRSGFQGPLRDVGRFLMPERRQYGLGLFVRLLRALVDEGLEKFVTGGDTVTIILWLLRILGDCATFECFEKEKGVKMRWRRQFIDLIKSMIFSIEKQSVDIQVLLVESVVQLGNDMERSHQAQIVECFPDDSPLAQRMRSWLAWRLLASSTQPEQRFDPDYLLSWPDVLGSIIKPTNTSTQTIWQRNNAISTSNPSITAIQVTCSDAIEDALNLAMTQTYTAQCLTISMSSI